MRRHSAPGAPMPRLRSMYASDTPYPSPNALRFLHIVAALVHSASCVAATYLMTTADVYIPIWFERITYATGAEPGFVQHSHKETAFKFHSLRVLLGFVGTTAVFHLFYATLRGAGAYGNPWRWIEYGITATMLTLNAAVGVGVSSVDAVILLIASSACMQVSGLGLELSRGMPWMREIFLFIGFTIVISIIISIAWYSTTASGSLVNTERIASVYGVYYGSFGVAATLRAYDIGAWRSAAWTELVYIVLSLSSKTSLFWMSFGGTRQMIEHLAPAEPRKGVDWAYVQDVAAFAPGAVAIAFLLIAAFLKPRARENKAIVMCGDEPGFIATIS